jgi:serine/threonine protein kinase
VEPTLARGLNSYSLGCTLYKLLSGQSPFTGPAYRHVAAKMMAHLERTPPAIASLRPEVSPELAAVVERMMAKDPAQRFDTPAALAAALAPTPTRSCS